MPHIYTGRQVALATKHEKGRLIARPLRAAVGLQVVLAAGIDTDQLGTFSGEIERQGSQRETALRKAHLGMAALGLPLGLASEGSFGPHPYVPFMPVNQELLLFVDDEAGFQVAERAITEKTNYAQITVASAGELSTFLTRAGFPSHALIVRPNAGFVPGYLFKGIDSPEALERAVQQAAGASADGRASRPPSGRLLPRMQHARLGRCGRGAGAALRVVPRRDGAGEGGDSRLRPL